MTRGGNETNLQQLIERVMFGSVPERNWKISRWQKKRKLRSKIRMITKEKPTFYIYGDDDDLEEIAIHCMDRGHAVVYGVHCIKVIWNDQERIKRL